MSKCFYLSRRHLERKKLMKEAGEFCYENVKFGFPSKYQGVKKERQSRYGCPKLSDEILADLYVQPQKQLTNKEKGINEFTLARRSQSMKSK